MRGTRGTVRVPDTVGPNESRPPVSTIVTSIVSRGRCAPDPVPGSENVSGVSHDATKIALPILQHP